MPTRVNERLARLALWVNGCYKSQNGQLRLIDPATDSCHPSETAISWGQTGTQGPKGDKGDKGDPGSPDRQGRRATRATRATRGAPLGCSRWNGHAARSSAGQSGAVTVGAGPQWCWADTS